MYINMLDYSTNRNLIFSPICDNHIACKATFSCKQQKRGKSSQTYSQLVTPDHEVSTEDLYNSNSNKHIVVAALAGSPRLNILKKQLSFHQLWLASKLRKNFSGLPCFLRPSVPDKIPSDLLIIHKLLQINAHWGSRTSNSAFKPYLLGFRNGIAIINLEQTVMCLQRALKFLKYVIRKKGHLLFINHDPECARIIQKTAEKTGQSCLINKWIGGFLTNRRQMNDSVSLTDFTGSFVAPKIDTSPAHLTKASFHFKTTQRPKDTTKGSLLFSPLRFATPNSVTRSGQTVGKTFDCLIIFNPNYNAAAILEAHRAQIAIVSIVDSDTSNSLISKITYPIPINSRSFQCVYYICHLMIQTILQIKTK